jgi:hypothetical protein
MDVAVRIGAQAKRHDSHRHTKIADGTIEPARIVLALNGINSPM